MRRRHAVDELWMEGGGGACGEGWRDEAGVAKRRREKFTACIFHSVHMLVWLKVFSGSSYELSANTGITAPKNGGMTGKGSSLLSTFVRCQLLQEVYVTVSGGLRGWSLLQAAVVTALPWLRHCCAHIQAKKKMHKKRRRRGKTQTERLLGERDRFLHQRRHMLNARGAYLASRCMLMYKVTVYK